MSLYALVPGGSPVLGYGGDRFVPTAEQSASYTDSADEYGLPTLAEFVDSMTSPLRNIDLPVMLVAADPVDAHTTALDPYFNA
jgi:hypothetical protein